METFFKSIWGIFFVLIFIGFCFGFFPGVLIDIGKSQQADLIDSLRNSNQEKDATIGNIQSALDVAEENYNDLSGRHQATQKELAQVQNQLHDSTSELREMKTTVSDQAHIMALQEDSIISLQTTNRGLQEDIENRDNKIDQYKKEVKEQENTIKDQAYQIRVLQPLADRSLEAEKTVEALQYGLMAAGFLIVLLITIFRYLLVKAKRKGEEDNPPFTMDPTGNPGRKTRLQEREQQDQAA